MAVVRVLERLGFEVQVPLDQTCCGQPAFNGGFHDEARQVARHTVDVLERTEGPIVVPSGSCGDMIVHQYAFLFEGDAALAARARAVAARTVEFSRFVAEHATEEMRGALKTRVAYHPSCHLLRGLGISKEPLSLIDRIDGATSVEFKDHDECCGFGGLFSIKNAEISAALLERKIAAVEAAGADRIVSCDLGCLMHIGGGLHRRGSLIRAQHLASLLDEALS